MDEIALNDKSQLEQCTLAMYGKLDQILLYNKNGRGDNHAVNGSAYEGKTT